MAPIKQPMAPLPIDSSMPYIIERLAKRSLVLLAPPGSGKTTRVPPALLRSGLLSAEYPSVVVLQPRRVAARSSAARIADEQGWALGDEVGYQVRFERRLSGRTRLRFLTEGVLTRQLLADPFLEGVGAVILDEFHERNLNSDLALALLRQVRREVRPDLILVVMSATLDPVQVSDYLDGCPIARVDGGLFEVSVQYRPVSRPADAAMIGPLIEERLSEKSDSGHLLVFLPGFGEIRRLARRLAPAAASAGAVVLPLHGSLSAEEQDRALRPSERRKIILSTNVAETSLTIDGVTTVIDCGLARTVRYDGARGIDRWETCPISRASADQRAGRAGRTGPGTCVRLWSEREQRGRPEFEQPEIHRVDLSTSVLALHAWGVRDPATFDWFDAPNPERLADAERLLRLLGAVDGNPPRITTLGEAILALPVHPRLARLLVAARECHRAKDGATIAALLSEKDIRLSETRERTESQGERRLATRSESDILDRLDLMAEAEAASFAPSLRSRAIDPAQARQVARLRDDLLGRPSRRNFEATSSDRDTNDDLLKCILLAYPDRVVKRRGLPGTGVMVGGRGVCLGPESVVRDADLYVAIDAREDRRAGVLEARVTLASVVRLEWLEELFPEHVRLERETRYDEPRRRVVSTNQLWYHDLLLREDLIASTEPAIAGPHLAGALRAQAPSFFQSNPNAAQWLSRLDLLRRSLPELSWPEFNDQVFAELLENVCEGKSRLEEAERTDLVPYLQSRLTPAQNRELHESAPQMLSLPNGRLARLAYEPGRAPVLSVRLQELFGWTEVPRLARGRVPVLLHLLGPNNRPVQITDDLKSFWSTTYHQVRKDLRRRYPKHAWPEDPLQAQATKPPKRSS
jgi:ATP-dependent helicase HrpB